VSEIEPNPSPKFFEAHLAQRVACTILPSTIVIFTLMSLSFSGGTQIARNCLKVVFVESGEGRAKPASALNFVEFDGILPQLLESVGIDSPSRHHCLTAVD